jgi:2-polyprenyl-3-methyl-5-hydroxy-6-metoxy-1,4-benzoquinol methylase
VKPINPINPINQKLMTGMFTKGCKQGRNRPASPPREKNEDAE